MIRRIATAAAALALAAVPLAAPVSAEASTYNGYHIKNSVNSSSGPYVYIYKSTTCGGAGYRLHVGDTAQSTEWTGIKVYNVDPSYWLKIYDVYGNLITTREVDEGYCTRAYTTHDYLVVAE